MAKKKNELATVAPTAAVATTNSPMVGTVDVGVMLMAAIDKGMDVATLERIMLMRKELKAEAAQAAFNEAKAKLQGELPIVKKTKTAKNKSGVKMYGFAPLEAITEQTNGPIANNGFSYSFKTEVTAERVKAFCIVTHLLGHTEITDIDVPLVSKTDIMNAPQQVAATITFAKRYAFINAFGISVADEDNDAHVDGTKPAIAPVTRDQLDSIERLAMTLELSRDYVVKRCQEIYGVTYPNISATQAEGIIQMMKKKLTEPKTTV